MDLDPDSWGGLELGLKIGPVKTSTGHQVKKVKQFFFRDLELRYMFLGQIFAKNAKNDPKTLFEASKSVKKQSSENHGKVPK